MGLHRALPNKKGMGAAFAVLGSTFTGLMRYCFGRWIPTFEQLMYSKVSPQTCNSNSSEVLKMTVWRLVMATYCRSTSWMSFHLN